ncbi:MAG: hypothetical protein CMO60_01075 [Verrucomicrobiales bacterium]|nr:hypothetical protein [Verrucomicrobiales bacterium]
MRKKPAGNPRASGLVLTLLLILPLLGFVPKYAVTVSDSVSQDPPSLLISGSLVSRSSRSKDSATFPAPEPAGNYYFGSSPGGYFS